MKRFLMKATVVVAMVFAGFSMTGCTDYERGIVAGAVVGAAVSGAYHHNGHNYGTNRNNMYRSGVRNGCSSANGRWYKSSYNWRNYSSYRNGWRAGYRRCR